MAKTAEWVAAEVARVTVHRDDIDADRLMRSLTLLSRGVDEWNRFRAGDPDFVPYLPAVDIPQCRPRRDESPRCRPVRGSPRAGDLRGGEPRRRDVQRRLDAAGEPGRGGRRLRGLPQRAPRGRLVRAGRPRARRFPGREPRNGGPVVRRRIRLSGADLTGAHVYGASVWGVELEGARQQGLVTTSGLEPAVFVDDLEVAQFLYTMLNHAKLRKAIAAVSARGVLLLGRFRDGGLELLQAVADRLRELGYLQILFDFDRPENRSYTETIMVLVGLSRFVVADLSGPSVPQELYATVPHFKIPFVPILESARTPHGMAPDLLEYRGS